MKVLDLFCGMGGWSIGFRRQGFEPTGLDIDDVGYPYDFILDDIRDFDGNPFKGKFEVIVASPPCTEYSSLAKFSALRGQRPFPDPEKGNLLVKEAKRVIEQIQPRFWVLENVKGSLKPIYSILGVPRMRYGPWQLWGNFPRFLMPSSNMKKWNGSGEGSWLDRPLRFNPLGAWLRAKIPIGLSEAIAKACKESLTV